MELLQLIVSYCYFVNLDSAATMRQQMQKDRLYYCTQNLTKYFAISAVLLSLELVHLDFFLAGFVAILHLQNSVPNFEVQGSDFYPCLGLMYWTFLNNLCPIVSIDFQLY